MNKCNNIIIKYGISKEIFIFDDGYYIKCTIYFLNICLTNFGKRNCIGYFAGDFNNPNINEEVNFFYFTVIGSVFLSGQLKNGYEINITIMDLQDSTVFLAYDLATSSIYTKIQLNWTGQEMEFSADSRPCTGYIHDCASGKKIF